MYGERERREEKLCVAAQHHSTLLIELESPGDSKMRTINSCTNFYQDFHYANHGSRLALFCQMQDGTGMNMTGARDARACACSCVGVVCVEIDSFKHPSYLIILIADRSANGTNGQWTAPTRRLLPPFSDCVRLIFTLNKLRMMPQRTRFRDSEGGGCTEMKTPCHPFGAPKAQSCNLWNVGNKSSLSGGTRLAARDEGEEERMIVLEY